MICMHRDLFWAKRAQKIRFFQMKKCTDIIIEKQICDNFTIKDGIFENNFEVDKYIINTVKKTGILVSNISAISNKKGITTGNERLRYLFYVKLKIVSPDLPKLQFYRYAAGVRLFEREALWRQPVPYNDEGC